MNSGCNVLDVALDLGLQPRHVASTGQGEYSSSCPFCGGQNRFRLWPNEGRGGRYWCRQCDRKGDAIQLCRDACGLTYPEACERLGALPRSVLPDLPYRPPPRPSTSPSLAWQAKAEAFVAKTHRLLLANAQMVQQLKEDRGLDMETMLKARLGWNPRECREERMHWDLPVTAGKSILYLPRGMVIPRLEGRLVQGIKVRRSDWVPEDRWPKYWLIAGSKSTPSIYGEPFRPFFVVESELDALLVQQEARDLVRCLALGGVSNSPDQHVEAQLRAEPFLLSLDYDDAGRVGYEKWQSHYPNAVVWPSDVGKSVGDMRGADLRAWVVAGLQRLEHTDPSM